MWAPGQSPPGTPPPAQVTLATPEAVPAPAPVAIAVPAAAVPARAQAVRAAQGVRVAVQDAAASAVPMMPPPPPSPPPIAPMEAPPAVPACVAADDDIVLHVGPETTAEALMAASCRRPNLQSIQVNQAALAQPQAALVALLTTLAEVDAECTRRRGHGLAVVLEGNLSLELRAGVKLPTDLTVLGCAQFETYSGAEKVSMPHRLVIQYDLSITGDSELLEAPCIALPDCLIVRGNLFLAASVAALPEDLSIHGELACEEEACIKAPLPAKLSVGSFSIGGDARLAFPDSCAVTGDLTLEDATEVSLPSDALIVNGSMRITSSWMLESRPFADDASAQIRLPRAIVVRGRLSLEGLYVEKLPGFVDIGAGLLLSHLPALACWPKELRLDTQAEVIIHGCPRLDTIDAAILRMPEGCQRRLNVVDSGVTPRRLREIAAMASIDMVGLPKRRVDGYPSTVASAAGILGNGPEFVRSRLEGARLDLQDTEDLTPDRLLDLLEVASPHFRDGTIDTIVIPARVATEATLESLARPAGLDVVVVGDLLLVGSSISGLPPTLEVRGRLSLVDCHSLQCGPLMLHVHDACHIVGCAALITLSWDFKVDGNCLVSALPALRHGARHIQVGGQLNVEGDVGHGPVLANQCLRVTERLSVSGWTPRTLAPKVRVGGDLRVERAPDLVSLGDDVRVGGHALMATCMSFNHIAESTACFHRDVTVYDCQSFQPPPESFYDQGGWARGVQPRTLRAFGVPAQTREAIEERARTKPWLMAGDDRRGLGRTHQDAFGSTWEAVAFWRGAAEGGDEGEDALVPDPRRWTQVPDTGPASLATVNRFLYRLCETAEYADIEAGRTALARRLVGLLRSIELAEDAALQAHWVGLMHDALATCGDRVALGLFDLELSVCVHQAGCQQEADGGAALRRLGASLLRLEVLHKHANAKVARLIAAGEVDVEEVEIRLALVTKLAAELDLPAVSKRMLYERQAGLTHAEIQAARAEAMIITEDGPELKKFLRRWGPWQVRERRRAAKQVRWARLPEADERDLHEPICAITAEPTNDPVVIARPDAPLSPVCDLKALMRWWESNGTSPFDRLALDLAHLRRAALRKRKRADSGASAAEAEGRQNKKHKPSNASE